MLRHDVTLRVLSFLLCVLIGSNTLECSDTVAVQVATESSQRHLPKLTVDNYKLWSVNTKTYLEGKSLWTIVSGARPRAEAMLRNGEEEVAALPFETWDRDDARARSIILSTMSTTQAGHIMELTTARAQWDALKQIHQSSGTQRLTTLLKHFYTCRMEPSESIDELATRLGNLQSELKMISKNDAPSDCAKVVILLNALDNEYNQVKMFLEDSDDLTMERAIGKLKDVERRLKEDNKETTTVLFTKTRNKESKSQPRNATGSKQGLQCDHCNKPGHEKAQCWYLHPELKGDSQKISSRRKNNNQGAMSLKTMDNKEPASDTWTIDTGATHHMCNSRAAFYDYTAKKQPIYTSNGEHFFSEGYGNVAVEIMLPDGSTNQVNIKRALYTPDITTNLLSVGEIEDKGLKFEIIAGCCRITNRKGQLVAYGTKQNRLFHLSVVPPTANLAGTLTTRSTTPTSVRTWHRRLAHLGASNVQRLEPMVDGMDLQRSTAYEQVCEDCSKGKSTRSPSRQPMERATEKLELIHSDVGGPITPTSNGGNRYFVTFTDDLSRHTWIYMLKSKGECMMAFRNFRNMVQTESGLRIKRLRSDNGGEYDSNEAYTLFQRAGIQWEPTTPHSPEQNGVSERLNRTLIERLRCVISDSALDKTLWAEALRTVVYIKNRSPTSAIKGATPHEAWYGKKPNISHLRIIGCTAYAHIAKGTGLKKLDDRSIKCKLLGYEGRNQYRLWNPVTRKLIRSRDVIFDETEEIEDQGYRDPDPIQNTESTETRRPIQEDNQSTIVVAQPTSSNEATQLMLSPATDESTSSSTESPTRSMNEFFDADEELTHESPRRSGRVRRPRVHYTTSIETAVDPATYSQAIESAERKDWTASMEDELNSLKENETWSLVPLPAGRRALCGKWVYKTKVGANGEVLKHKARWVVKGYEQRHGVDYDQTFAAVVKPMAYKTLFALAARHDWEIEQMDVKTAFLHGTLDNEIFVEQPTGYDDGSGRVCRLNKSLYGLKQSPRVWYQTLQQFLATKGYHRTNADHSVFYNRDNGTILAAYVDDLLLIGPNLDHIIELKKLLSDEFQMTDLGPVAHYLGVQVSRDRYNRTLTMTQTTYLTRVLGDHGMLDCNSIKTPMETGINLVPSTIQATEDDTKAYQSAIGSLMYAMTATRPDIAFAVSVLSRFPSKPDTTHWKALTVQTIGITCKTNATANHSRRWRMDLACFTGTSNGIYR